MSKDAYRKLLRMIDGETREVVVVTGAPGSGKSTYVAKESTGRDLVVDLDLICKAITGSGNSTHSDFTSVLPVALKIRDVLYTAIKNHEGDWKKAYVITSAPSRSNISELIRELGAKEHRIQATREQCLLQIRQDDTREGRREEFINLANEWFDSNDS